MIDPNTLSFDELFTHLTQGGSLTRLLRLAFEEDLGPGGEPGDVTWAVMPDAREFSVGRVVVRGNAGVFAGGRCIPELLSVFAPKSKADLHVQDGGRVVCGDVVATITGPTGELLRAERTMLNLLSRLSGVATRTREFVDRIAGTHAKLLDTRKTTPGLRSLEKYAVRCGGGHCHRLGLYDGVMLKDNHIAEVPTDALAGFVRAAAARARSMYPGKLRFVELEIDKLEQLAAILSAQASAPVGVDVVLLDNMTAQTIAQAVIMRDRAGAAIQLEASGGVTLDTVNAIAQTGVDRISVGSVTHQAVGLDVALDFVGCGQ